MSLTSQAFLFRTVLVQVCVFILNGSPDSLALSSDVEDDPLIDPYNVREEGCPIVSERDKLDISKLKGAWHLPYASLNWLADIGMSLYNHSVRMSQITSICPKIVISESSSTLRNATLDFKFICPKLKGEFEIECWNQHLHTKSKFACWNDNEQRDMYLMVAATNHRDWTVLVRCSAKDENRPAEGMSWAVLSKTIPMETDVSDVLFGLLDGYGFDVNEYKTQLLYNDCPLWANP